MTDLRRLLLGLFAWEKMAGYGCQPKWAQKGLQSLHLENSQMRNDISYICMFEKWKEATTIRRIELLFGFSMVDSVTN